MWPLSQEEAAREEAEERAREARAVAIERIAAANAAAIAIAIVVAAPVLAAAIAAANAAAAERAERTRARRAAEIAEIEERAAARGEALFRVAGERPEVREARAARETQEEREAAARAREMRRIRIQALVGQMTNLEYELRILDTTLALDNIIMETPVHRQERIINALEEVEGREELIRPTDTLVLHPAEFLIEVFGRDAQILRGRVEIRRERLYVRVAAEQERANQEMMNLEEELEILDTTLALDNIVTETPLHREERIRNAQANVAQRRMNRGVPVLYEYRDIMEGALVGFPAVIQNLRNTVTTRREEVDARRATEEQLIREQQRMRAVQIEYQMRDMNVAHMQQRIADLRNRRSFFDGCSVM
jgi:hypothetical protein